MTTKAELEKQVKLLEQKVQRLNDQLVARASASCGHLPGNSTYTCGVCRATVLQAYD